MIIFGICWLFPVGGYAVGSLEDTSLYMRIIQRMITFLEDLDAGASSLGMPGFCWICPIFRVVFVGINIMVNTITGVLENSLIKLAGLILLFVLAFKILKNLIQLGGFSGTEFFKELFFAIFKVMVVVILLRSMNELWRYFLEPILNLALGIANHFTDRADIIESVTSLEKLRDYLDSKGIAFNVSSCKDLNCEVPNANAILGNSTCNNIMITICKFNAALVAGIGIGILLMGSSLELQDHHFNLILLVIGGIVFFSYITVIVKVPLMYVEAIFKMALVLALSPVLLLLWLMPATASYTVNALKNFIGSCLQIVFLSFMGIFAISMLNFSLGAGTQSNFIDAILDGKEISEILAQLPAGLFVVLWAWVSCSLATRFFEMASSFAEFFAQTGGSQSGLIAEIGKGVALLGKVGIQGMNRK